MHASIQNLKFTRLCRDLGISRFARFLKKKKLFEAQFLSSITVHQKISASKISEHLISQFLQSPALNISLML